MGAEGTWQLGGRVISLIVSSYVWDGEGLLEGLASASGWHTRLISIWPR